MPPKDSIKLDPGYFYIEACDKDNPIQVKRGDLTMEGFFVRGKRRRCE